MFARCLQALYIVLRLPYSIKVCSYGMMSRLDAYWSSDAPGGWMLYGSSDGVSWTLLDRQSGVTWDSAGQTQNFSSARLR